ncbi:MAG TPA: hypothetical protein VIJ43_05630 [Burkholderiales bacterium]
MGKEFQHGSSHFTQEPLHAALRGDDWTILGWQDRRVLNDIRRQGKDSNKKDISKTNTIIGVVYVGVLVIFMLVYLT